MHKFTGADGIRGIACLIVLLLHNTGMYMGSSGIYTQGVEKYGVWLFFILSAFLLSYKIINEEKPGNYLIFYFLSRSIRIIPAFYICVIIYWYFGSFDYRTMIDVLTFKGTYGHFWTIPVEFKFYFLLPVFAIAAAHINDKYGTHSLLYVSLALLIVHQAYYPCTKTPENSIDLVWYLPVFLFGTIISVIYSRNKTEMPDNIRDMIGFLIVLLLITVSPGLIKSFYQVDNSVNLMNKYIPLGLLLAVFTLCL